MKRKSKSKAVTQKKLKGKSVKALIPQEINMEILSWLPAKSLLRFKCVNKSWCVSISDPNFLKLQFNRAIESDNSGLLLIGNPEYSNSEFPITDLYSVEEGGLFENLKKIFIPLEGDFMVWGSCNGVVCMGDAYDLCLLNPATKCYEMVAFENAILSHVKVASGFYYDPLNEDCVVVVIVYKSMGNPSDTDYEVEINVYPINDNSQGSSVIPVNTPYAIENEEQGGVYLSGALHWIGLRNRPWVEGEKLERGTRPMEIVSFDVMEKVFQIVPSPDTIDDSAFLSVGVSRGKLCMLSCVVKGVDMDMWVMNTYGARESWSKLYSIAQSITHTVFGRGSLFFTRNGEVLLHNWNNCVLYDPKHNEAQDIEIPVTSDGTRPDTIVSYMSSLISLQSNTKLDS